MSVIVIMMVGVLVARNLNPLLFPLRKALLELAHRLQEGLLFRGQCPALNPDLIVPVFQAFEHRAECLFGLQGFFVQYGSLFELRIGRLAGCASG